MLSIGSVLEVIPAPYPNPKQRTPWLGDELALDQLDDEDKGVPGCRAGSTRDESSRIDLRASF
jgi:hypothetical protein